MGVKSKCTCKNCPACIKATVAAEAYPIVRPPDTGGPATVPGWKPGRFQWPK